MTKPFRDAPLDVEGTTTPITLNNRFRQEVNVEEFANQHSGAGIFGSGSGDDTPCFQAAANAAFKTGGEWHGLANSHLNRPIKIPNGRFACSGTVDLVKVVGGNIVGQGMNSVHFLTGGQILFNMNGCSYVTFEQMQIEAGGSAGDGSCIVKVDWDGDNSGNGCDGNHHNHFKHMNTGTNSQYGFIIGSDAASQGHGTCFTQVNVNGGYTGDPAVFHTTGILVKGPNATVNTIGGGGIHQRHFIHCPAGGGSAWSTGWSTGTETVVTSSVDFFMESGGVMNIGQGRSESTRFARVTTGNVSITDVTTTGASPAIEVNGGIVTVENCQLGGLSGSYRIIGTGGQMILAGMFINRAPPNINYSGTILFNLPVIT